MSPIQKEHKKIRLRKALGLREAIIYGVGVILGAGIYALIGEAAGIAGNSLWISFLFGAIIASFTALSYAELSSIFPKEAAEFSYVKNSTGSSMLAFVVQYFAFISLIVSAPAVAYAFGGYFTGFIGIGIFIGAAGLIIILSALNFIGMRESAKFNNVATIIEAAGLVLIIALGASMIGSVNYLEVPGNPIDLTGFAMPIVAATALVFFAYLGFEELANIAEETRDAKKNIPIAVIASLGIATVLYILVSIVAVSVVPYGELSGSTEPVALIAERAAGGGFGSLLGLIALFATANTVLVLLIVSSRMLYGMAAQGSLPRIFSDIHERTGTPWFSVLFSCIAALAFLTVVNDLGNLALLTNMAIFVSFFAVNASLIIIRLYLPHFHPGFRAPFNIGNFPVTALLGALASLAMLPQMLVPMEVLGVEVPLLLFGLLLGLTGVPVYYIAKWARKETAPRPRQF